ncbi:ADP-ribosylation factor 2, partial [Datura stramonium]|nr:ADP-ribosylation factor 2 [Datura stramonium]
TSPAEFIVPYDHYMESVKNNYSIGMRFKMRFEGEEAPEQRFTGTIVGIEDADPKRWLESKWRCLKVRWDENSTIPRPDRVSPWKIEPALSPPALNAPPVARPKRPRSSILPSSPDSSVLTREGSSRITADHSLASGFSRVLQGQELSTFRGGFAESNESDLSEKQLIWQQPSADDEKNDIRSASKRYLSDKWVPLGRPESSLTDLLSGFGVPNNSPHGFCLPSADQTSFGAGMVKRQAQDQEKDFSLLGKPWSLLSSSLSLNLMDSASKAPGKGCDAPYQMRGDTRYNGFGEFSVLPGHRVENQQGSWIMPQQVSPYIQLSSHSREMMHKPTVVKQSEAVKSKEGNCKLFGIPLTSNVCTDPVMMRKSSLIASATDMSIGIHPHQSPATDSDQRSEQSKGSKVDDGIAANDHDKQFHTFNLAARDRDGKGHSSSTRSCTKVHKQGTALGRSVDLAKFNNYDELIAELDQLFEFNGELKAQSKSWLVVYTDDEGDMMLVGDDPWLEFCGMVRKIFIYTKEEVQRMNPGTLNSKGEDTSSVAEGSDAKEVKNLQLPSESGQEES